MNLAIKFILALIFAPVLGFGANIPKLLPLKVDVNDKSALQRGARIYMNYCSGCHSLRYLRYSRMAKDLGLITFSGEVDKPLLQNNLIFTSAKVHDPIEVSMPKVSAREWFGRIPPDLSLTAREKGPAWIYTYLKSFYEDKNRPYGTNNILVPDVAMPNVLAPLSGKLINLHKSINYNDNSANLLLIERGTMTQHQFDSTVIDLVTFLTYVAEPSQLIRYQVGVYVIIFLLVFLLPAYLLKRHYWKNIS